MALRKQKPRKNLRSQQGVLKLVISRLVAEQVVYGLEDSIDDMYVQLCSGMTGKPQKRPQKNEAIFFKGS